MPWVRLDDGYPEHPKVDRVGPLAAWLNVCAWAYCARNLTDGFVPAERVARLANVPNATKLAKALVEAHLWEAADGGYMVHDYLSYNPSREQVRDDRAKTAERVARHRNGVSNGVTPPDTNGGSNVHRNGVGNGVSTDAPYPSRINPGDVDPPTPLSGRKANPKSKPTRTPISDEEIEELVGQFSEQYGNRQAVRDEIDLALNHQARYKSLREKLYVKGWLQRELNQRPAWRVVGGKQMAQAPRRLPPDRTGVAN